MGADNNLERFAIKNIKDLQKTGSTDEINFIVLFDRSPGYDTSEGNWTDTKLFYISHAPDSFNDDALMDYGELNMTDPNNIYIFLKFVNTYFPADHTVLNIWSHGRGVYPDGVIPVDRGVIEDYSTGYGAAYTMSIMKLHSAIKEYVIETQKNIDIVQFDACDMQMVEVCYELKDICNYIVGSETEVPGNGSDYYDISEFMVNKPDISSKELAIYLCDSFYNYYYNTENEFSCSAVETGEFENFIKNLNTVCSDLLTMNDAEIKKIAEKRSTLKVIVSSYPEYMDLDEFLVSAGLNSVYSIQTSLDNLIVEKKTSVKFKELGGIGINYPYTKILKDFYMKKENSDYEYCSFYRDSLWDEVLDTLWKYME